MATMAKIKARIRIAPIFGGSVADVTQSCWDCSIQNTYAFVSLDRNRVWIGHGWGYPTGYTGGPYPDKTQVLQHDLLAR